MKPALPPPQPSPQFHISGVFSDSGHWLSISVSIDCLPRLPSQVHLFDPCSPPESPALPQRTPPAPVLWYRDGHDGFGEMRARGEPRRSLQSPKLVQAWGGGALFGHAPTSLPSPPPSPLSWLRATKPPSHIPHFQCPGQAHLLPHLPPHPHPCHPGGLSKFFSTHLVLQEEVTCLLLFYYISLFLTRRCSDRTFLPFPPFSKMPYLFLPSENATSPSLILDPSSLRWPLVTASVSGLPPHPFSSNSSVSRPTGCGAFPRVLPSPDTS